MTSVGPCTSGLADRLATAAATLTPLPKGTPAVVLLARAFNGFYQARMVAVFLDEYTTPARDAYPLTQQWTTPAMNRLFDVVGRRLIYRYCPDHVGGMDSLTNITALAQVELFNIDDAGIERITNAMISLAARLEDVLNAVAADESVLPDQRGAARTGASVANLVWAHFGGDSGGW